MKKRYRFEFALLFVCALMAKSSLAQDNSPNGFPERGATLRGHTGPVISVAISPDGRTLASGSVDSTIVLWNLAPRIVPPTASADFDGSGAVDFADFVQFAANFGLNQGDTGFDAQFDLDMDGTIGFGDFLIFAKAFGE